MTALLPYTKQEEVTDDAVDLIVEKYLIARETVSKKWGTCPV